MPAWPRGRRAELGCTRQARSGARGGAGGAVLGVRGWWRLWSTSLSLAAGARAGGGGRARARRAHFSPAFCCHAPPAPWRLGCCWPPMAALTLWPPGPCRCAAGSDRCRQRGGGVGARVLPPCVCSPIWCWVWRGRAHGGRAAAAAAPAAANGRGCGLRCFVAEEQEKTRKKTKKEKES